MRREAVTLRGERDRRNEPLADDGDRRIARQAVSVNQHDVAGRQAFDLARREAGGSDTQAYRHWQIESGATDPGMPIKPFREPERVAWGKAQFAAGGHEPFDHNGKKQWRLFNVLQPLGPAGNRLDGKLTAEIHLQRRERAVEGE